MIYQISEAVSEKLKYYIYALKDPRKPIGEYFYIGKGHGNRCLQHITCAIKTDISNLKYDTIKDIINHGYDVQIDILRHNIDNEDLAYEIESICIDIYNQNHLDSLLSNIVAGHHQFDYGIQDLSEIIIKYDAKPITLKELELNKYKYICLNANRSYKNNNIYEDMRGWWGLNYNKALETDYVLIIYKGIIRNVFKPNKWERNIDDPKLVRFEGEEIHNSKFINKYIGHLIVFNQKGSRYLTFDKIIESMKKNNIKI